MNIEGAEPFKEDSVFCFRYPILLIGYPFLPPVSVNDYINDPPGFLRVIQLYSMLRTSSEKALITGSIYMVLHLC